MVRSVLGCLLLLQGAAAFLQHAKLRALPPPRASTTRHDFQMKEHALIIQNKGGGHGEIGYHLAKTLAQDKGLSVTILNDKYSESKEPFKSYGKLKDMGVEIIAADLASADVGALLAGKSFAYIFDNFSKKPDNAKVFAELAIAKSWPVQDYVFVSSGGMYKAEDEFPILETDAVSDSNDARQIELYLAITGLPYTFFRPQYIYGPLTNKRDYLDWFFDRVVRGRPLPLPKHGEQFTTLTHVEDIASLLASVVGNPKAINQVFNAASNRYVTAKEVCRLVGQVVGKNTKGMITTYDPSKFKADIPKGWYPFRNTHFNVCPEKANLLLGWTPKHNLLSDLQEYYEGYMAVGGDKKDVSFEVDEKILAGK